MSPRNSPTIGQANVATAIALFGLILISAALLGLMAMVLPQLLGIVVVFLVFLVPAAFHYVVWGWWLSQMREEEVAAEETTEKVEDRG